MAVRAQVRARRAWIARRGLLVAAVGCGVLGLQSLPNAAAAKAAAGSTAAPSAETTAAARRAERAAAKAEAPPAPRVAAPLTAETAPPPPAIAHGRRGAPGGHAAPPPPPPLGAGAGAAPRGGASRGTERPVSPARARREERRGETTTAAAADEGPAAGEDSSSANAVALARSQRKGTGKKEKPKAKEKEGHKEKGKKTTTPPDEEPAEEGSSVLTVNSKGGLSVAEPTQPTAVAASVSASATAAAPTPAGGTGTASISSLAATAKAQPVSGSRASGSARARAAGHRARQGATAPAGTTSTTPLAPLRAPAATTVAGAQPRAKRAHKSSTQPAIVKTITRIVGVVPTPVRILILALIALALLLGARSLFSGVRTRRLVRQRGELLEDVGVLQAALLPVPPQRLGPVGTSVAYRPADGPGAGGDFYDVFALEDGRLAVIVGDVSGHGREALPHTALLRFTVRAYLEAGLAPGKALQTAGNVLERQLAGSFATVVAAIYHPRERTLTYASAGHPPPVVLGEQATAKATTAIAPVTACSAPPIGAGMRTGTRQTVVSIPGPARLCFHTDGVTEARVAGELFGAERLIELLTELDADADASALLDRVAERSDARPDDMAACLLRVQDGAGAPSIVFEQLELDREGAANPRVKRFLLDCGVPQAEAELLMRDARARLEHTSSILLELQMRDGRPVVSLHEDNVIHPAALAAASAG
jgi:Stage II sporulation protein E (SpoIIE)